MSAVNRSYIIRRIVLLFPMLVALSMIVFSLIHLSPGDPALALAGEQALNPATIDQVRENLGLNRSLPVQYGIWMSNIVQLDFGISYGFNRKPVIDLIVERTGPTLILQAAALSIALAISLPVGILSAKRSFSLFDQSAQAGSLLGLSVPDFWVALILQLLFAVSLGWLPSSTSGAGTSGPARLQYLVLPVIVLAFPTVAVLSRYMRTSMIEVVNQDYVATARAKGLNERQVIYVHALRNALLPIVTVVGAQMARLLSGSVIVEYIFAWPGLGSLAYESILRRDYPVILAITLITGAFILVMNVVVDILYAVLDPRISFD